MAAVALATSYALLPLYSSNQNHHFLIGLARAGEGFLADDWLSATADPFPLFSAYVTFVHRHLTDWLHYVVYYALFGAYGYGLMRVAEEVRPLGDAAAGTAARAAFLAVLCILHNEVFGYLALLDLARMPWWQMTHWGVAEQEIFGHGAFQASSFGMLLPLAIALALAGRRRSGALLASSVLLVHFSYALTAAALVSAFMWIEFRESRRLAGALAVGGLALLLALPAAIDVLVRLGPTSPETSTAAAAILARHLPQETAVTYWFGWKALLQALWIVAGMTIAAGTPLLPMMAAPFAAGLLLSLVQVAIGSPRLALLFPWRVSVLLVPIATALVVWSAVAAWVEVAAATRRRRIVAMSTVLTVVSMLVGAVRMTLHFAYFYGDRRVTSATDRFLPERVRMDFARTLEADALPAMRFVLETAKRGDLYLIPPELERFRTVSEAPALADLKSHPYKDAEVLEWRRRLDRTIDFFRSGGSCDAAGALAADYHVTHLVADRRIQPGACAVWEKMYADEAFAVFRIRPVPDATLGFSSQ